jgi:hypothetical protein
LKKREKSTTDQVLLVVITVLFVLMNIMFILGKFYPLQSPNFCIEVFQMMKENRGYFTALEFLGVATLFVDLIGRFEQFSKNAKILRVLAVAFIMVMFLVKIFVFYIDSAYLTE